MMMLKPVGAPPVTVGDAFGPPPFNLDAEQALLGALLMRNDVFEDVAQLDRAHFFDPLHASIFDVVTSIIRSGRKATLPEVLKFFEDSEPVDANTTAKAYILRLMREVPTLTGAKEYARVILNAALCRNLIVIGEDIIMSAREINVDREPQVLIEEAEERLFNLTEAARFDNNHVMDFGTAAELAWQEIQSARDGKKRSLQTGLVDLDRKLGGMQPSNLIVLAGRPSMGKTALATNIAFNVAKNKETGGFVDFYSLEMSGTELANRIISFEVRKASSDFRNGTASPDMVRRAGEVVQSLKTLALGIDQTGGISIATLTARARRNKRRRGTKLVVVDYLQLMQASRRKNPGNRVEDVTEITSGLKTLAKELDVPVLALSQLNRAVESRDNKRPQLSDLRESGSIEQDADVVMFVYRDEYYVERDRPADKSDEKKWLQRLASVANKAEVIIGKQRHGETGTVDVGFKPDLTQFYNLARQEVSNDRA